MGKLDRIFQEAQNAAAEEDGVPVRGLEAALKSGEDDDADAKRASLPIAERILADYEKGNFFACLGLPAPDCDDAGRPVWDVSESVISKAYRRASLAVHPDKNPLPEAKAAFDKLNDAVRALRDDVRRGEALRSFADAAFQEKCRANPELMAKAKKAQERVDAENYGDMIRAQQSQQLERARLQREKAKLIAIRRRNREADGASSSDVSTDTDSDDDDDDDAKADVREEGGRPGPGREREGGRRGRLERRRRQVRQMEGVSGKSLGAAAADAAEGARLARTPTPTTTAGSRGRCSGRRRSRGSSCEARTDSSHSGDT
jgi:curved DNA-binding protein CbpA